MEHYLKKTSKLLSNIYIYSQIVYYFKNYFILKMQRTARKEQKLIK